MNERKFSGAVLGLWMAAIGALAPASAAAMVHGIGLNPTSDVKGQATPTQIKAKLDDLGVTSIRAWFTVSDWNTPPSASAFSMYKTYHDMGIKVMVVFAIPENSSSSKIPTYTQAKNYFSAAATAANGAIDYWEIGNEPNLTQYWPGGSANMSPYVTGMLKGAWDALHPKGLKVVGAGACCSTSDLQKLVTLGYLNYADYANFHPYGGDATTAINRAKAARTIVGSKPLFFTEWNIQGGTNLTAWNAALPTIYAAVSPIVDGLWYFRLINASNTPASAGSTLKADLTENKPFYATLRTMYGGSSSAGEIFPPAITQQPASKTVTAGQTATFTVAASGTLPLNYQWKKAGVAISGATSASYTTPATTGSDNGALFTCSIGNMAGSVTSSAATLTVTAAPAPTPTPTPSTATATLAALYMFNETAGTSILDGSGNANAGAFGTPAPTRTAGFINGGLSFAAGASAVVPNSATLGGLASFSYAAWIYPTGWGDSGYGRIVSRESAAGRDDNYLFLSQAETTLGFNMGNGSYNAYAAAGAITLGKWQHVAVTFDGSTKAVKLYVDGVETTSYQTTIPAASAMTLNSTRPIVIGNRAGLDRTFLGAIDGLRVYRGALTAAEVLKLRDDDAALVTTTLVAPAITQQPAAVSAAEGQTATFSVAATGSAPLVFQWKRNGTPIAGATSASYTTPPLASSDGGSTFSCTASNAAGSATSAAATLTVTGTLPPPPPPPPDSGWTSLSLGSGGKKYYVAASGADANSGTDPAAPTSLKSIASRMSAGSLATNDWVLFKRGDTFLLTSALRISESGMVVGAYGVGNRPKLVADTALHTALALNAGLSNVSIVDLHITAAHRDPGASDFQSGLTKDYGIDARSATVNLLIEGCRIEFFRQNVAATSGTTDPAGFRFRRNVSAHAYDEGTGVAVGLYVNGMDGALIEENVFDTNGWDPRLKVTYLNSDGSLNKSRLQFHHGIYYGNYNPVPNLPVVRRNIFFNSASTGLQQRTGGVMDDNLFIHNGTAADGFTEGVYGAIVNNVVLGSRETPVIGTGGGLLFASASGIMANNIVAHGAAGIANGAAYMQADPSGPDQTYLDARNSPASSSTIVNNILYDWPGDGFRVWTNRSKNVFSRNAFVKGAKDWIQLHTGDRAFAFSYNTFAVGSADKVFRLTNNYQQPFATFESAVAGVGDALGAPVFADPAASIESYASALGLAASAAAFIAKADAQEKGDGTASRWDDRFTAGGTNRYIRSAFRRTSSSIIATGGQSGSDGSGQVAPSNASAPLVYVRRGIGGASAPAAQPRALLLTMNGGESLVLSPEVAEVSWVGLDGRTYLSSVNTGGGERAISLAGAQAPTGYSILRYRTRTGQWGSAAVIHAR